MGDPSIAWRRAACVSPGSRCSTWPRRVGTRRRPTARNPGASRNVCLLRLETDDGIVGWADIETQPTVARAALDAPDQWSFLGHPPHDHGPASHGGRPALARDARPDLLRPARRRDPGHVRGRQRLLRHHGQGLRRAALQAPGGQYRRPGEGVRVDALSDRHPSSCRPPSTSTSTAASVPSSSATGSSAMTPARTWSCGRCPRGGRAGRRADARPGLVQAEHHAAQHDRPVRATEPYDITWFEDCLHPENYEGYRVLCRESPIPIAAGGGHDLGYRQLLSADLGYVQPDLSRCGGLGRQTGRGPRGGAP